MDLTQAERSLLARVSFFLCRDGYVDEAEAGFRGLAESAPERAGSAVGLALCHIVKGENDKAVETLDRRLADPEAGLRAPLTLYKLVALIMAGRQQDADALRAHMRQCPDLAAAAKTAYDIAASLGAAKRHTE